MTTRIHTVLACSLSRTLSLFPLPFLSSLLARPPKVDNWSPELVTIEAKAKEESKILFFVIDNATRALASMLEASEYIGRGRAVVLVIQPVLPGAKVGNDVLSAAEIKDLNRAREYLKDVAARHGTPTFSGDKAIELAVADVVGRCNGRVELATSSEEAARRKLRDLDEDALEMEAQIMSRTKATAGTPAAARSL